MARIQYDPSIAHYLALANSQPLLTVKDEIELASTIKSGTKKQREEAARRLVLSHIPLIIKIASNVRNSGLPMPDLVQEGIVGLYRATTGKFDPKIARFSTYGFRWIDEGIRTYVRDNQTTVRIPASAQRKRQEVRKKAAELTTNGLVQYDAVAEALKMKPAKVAMFLTLGQESSLNEHVGDGDSEYEDFLADPNPVEPLAEMEETRFQGGLHEALNTLNEREKRIVMARFGLGEDDDEEATLEDLSVEFSISRERVRQIQVTALKKLAKTPQAKLLRDFIS